MTPHSLMLYSLSIIIATSITSPTSEPTTPIPTTPFPTTPFPTMPAPTISSTTTPHPTQILTKLPTSEPTIQEPTAFIITPTNPSQTQLPTHIPTVSILSPTMPTRNNAPSQEILPTPISVPTISRSPTSKSTFLPTTTRQLSMSGLRARVENSDTDILNTNCEYFTESAKAPGNAVFQCIKDEYVTYLQPHWENSSSVDSYGLMSYSKWWMWSSQYPFKTMSTVYAYCELHTENVKPQNGYNQPGLHFRIYSGSFYSCETYKVRKGDNFVIDNDMILLDVSDICMQSVYQPDNIRGQYSYYSYDNIKKSTIYYSSVTKSYIFGWIFNKDTDQEAYKWILGPDYNVANGDLYCNVDRNDANSFTTPIEDCQAYYNWFVLNDNDIWVNDDEANQRDDYCRYTTPSPFIGTPSVGLVVKHGYCQQISGLSGGGGCSTTCQGLAHSWAIDELNPFSFDDFGKTYYVTVENGCLYAEGTLMKNNSIVVFDASTFDDCPYENGYIYNCVSYICTQTQPIHCIDDDVEHNGNGDSNTSGDHNDVDTDTDIDSDAHNNGTDRHNTFPGGNNMETFSIVGSVIGGCILLIIIGILMWIFFIKPKMRKDPSHYAKMDNLELS